jgi:hypothetical protein
VASLFEVYCTQELHVLDLLQDHPRSGLAFIEAKGFFMTDMALLNDLQSRARLARILVLITALCSPMAVQALSCAVSATMPSAKDPRWREQEVAMFDAQTRARFADSELVADGIVVSLGETAYLEWTSSQMVGFKVSHYYRIPGDRQPSDIYNITATPNTLKIGQSILVFANPETIATTKARKPPAPGVEVPLGEIPRTWKGRVWYAQGACIDLVYPHLGKRAEETALVRTLLAQYALDVHAPAKLSLNFWLDQAIASPQAEIAVKIISANSGAIETEARVGEGNAHYHAPLYLPPGRYRLVWPEIPGHFPACPPWVDAANSVCELNVIPGGEYHRGKVYHAASSANVRATRANGEHLNLLGELIWQPVDQGRDSFGNKILQAEFPAYASYFSERNDEEAIDEIEVVSPRVHVIVPTPIAASSYDYPSDMRPLPTGRYRLYWQTHRYVETPPGSCEAQSTKRIPLRWRIPGAAQFDVVHELAPGPNEVNVELPNTLDTVDLKYILGPNVNAEVMPKCANQNRQSITGWSAAPLHFVALRGQQYQLEVHCPDCTPAIPAKQVLRADVSAEIELK